MYLRRELIQPRVYQEVIYARCKERNCLVVLPTGLGKTLIAMLIADYRLSKYGGKVLMLAPTKPLALQHRESFLRLFNLPEEAINTLTGELSPEKRREVWRRSKIITATPQTVENDLVTGRIDLGEVSLLVFDEAHRAVGNYAYVYIAKEYLRSARNPLVLGLTASPGGTEEKIREILKNLGIEHVEVRTERSPDVRPYVQGVKVEWVKVELPDLYKDVRKLLRELLKDSLKPLKEAGMIESYSPDVPKKVILEVGSRLNRELASGNYSLARLRIYQAMAMKLYHAIELLETQGLSALRAYLKKLIEEGKKGRTKSARILMEDTRMRKALALVVQASELGLDHPKMEKLFELVRAQLEAKENAKVIVFTNYRETSKRLATELNAMGIKAVRFVGQASRGKDKGMNQKKQKEILELFSAGAFPVLVATSVGEEGLDVPEVDLVVFYEPVPSAIRSIQRRGRTGRHRPGRVVVLMARGTRDEAYYWSSRRKEEGMFEALKRVSEMVKREKQASLTSFVKPKEAPKEEPKEAPVFEKPDKRGVTVYVDSRELKSGVPKFLKELGAEVVVKTLDVGDYVVADDVAIERKSGNDFIQSIIDGRLFEQMGRLREAYPRAVVIVEGELYGVRNVHPNAIRGALAALAVDWGVPILFSRDAKETASFIHLIARREQEEKRREVSLRGEKKALTLAGRQRLIVEGLPNVSATLAKRLLKHFGSVERVFTATEEELMEVEGIGEKKAREIRKVITAPYEEE
ncbi:DEAD/DEAH box helicase [Palaeococcus ferrophilus]|uniref:DEAD/DEAH box helicase n=1 Tax=Palaeococcus ferrophilus TaxID=83868 RepID=UPI00064F778E|nr:DEAD/DEAH box helicase [Palaeococcus ferrophilus]